MGNYISKIRKKLGRDAFIHPAARIIVENERGEILFIERLDTGGLGLPAGAFEENETIEQCIIREVKEETGLLVLAVELIGVSSSPEIETVSYLNGDQIQYFVMEFYANSFEGSIGNFDTDEVKCASFKAATFLNELPKNEQHIIKSLNYFKQTGKVRLN